MVERLILFAKRPRLGGVKTRLVPPLTPEQALALYEAMLEDQLRFVRSLARSDRAVELSLDEPWVPEAELADAAARLAVSPQGPGDLGERMLRAFERSHRAGTARTVIVGADSPTLPASRVESAFVRLGEGARVVVSPAEDGGYVLIGLRDPLPELFAGVPWGSSGVMAVTRRLAERSSVPLVELEPWYDVDDIDSLDRLGRDLGGTRAAATSRCLAALPERSLDAES